MKSENEGLKAQIKESEELQAQLQKQKETLEHTVSLLEETQRLAKIGSWEVDVESMALTWSDEVYRIHEVPVGSPVEVEQAINFYREDYRSIIQNAVDEGIANNKTWDEECVLITTSGEERWVRAIGYPVIEEGKLVKLRGLFMDINEQKQTQFRRKRAELKFRSIFDSTFNFTGLLQPDGTLIEANKSALDFGGFTLEDAQGLHFADAPWWSLSKEINEQLREAVKKAASGEFIRYDVDVVGVEGKIITIDFSINPIFNEEGEVVYLVPEGRDITEKKLLSEQLKTSEQQLRKFINQAPVAVAMVDTDMRYITTSQHWIDAYEIKEKDLTGKSHYDIFPEILNMPEWLDVHQRVLQGEEIDNPRDKFVREDGRVQWLRWKVHPWYQEPEEIGGIIMYTSDISEEVEYQQKLENLNEVLEEKVNLRTQELRELNKDLESFSYSVSHDLRAPLRSINGFTEILEHNYGEKLDNEGKRLLNIVRSNGAKMTQIIDDILAFSRLGRKEPRKQTVDAERLILEVMRNVEYNFSDSKIELKMGDLPQVEADRNLLELVLMNLFSNACKYSSHQDVIRIEVGAEEKNGFIILYIRDNGIGFKMKYHDKIFSVFQRLHTDAEYQGTGVGLAIAKRIMKKHGGDVWAESEPNEGSVFYLSFPNP